MFCLTAAPVMIRVIYGVTTRIQAANYQLCKGTHSTFKVDENGEWIFLRNVFNYMAQGCKNPRRQVNVATNLVRWFLIFVDPKYGSCFMQHVWRLEL